MYAGKEYCRLLWNKYIESMLDNNVLEMENRGQL